MKKSISVVCLLVVVGLGTSACLDPSIGAGLQVGFGRESPSCDRGDASAGDAGQTTDAGQHEGLCSGDQECIAGERCVRGQCLGAPYYEICYVSSDCVFGGYVCDDGICVDSRVRMSADSGSADAGFRESRVRCGHYSEADRDQVCPAESRCGADGYCDSSKP